MSPQRTLARTRKGALRPSALGDAAPTSAATNAAPAAARALEAARQLGPEALNPRAALALQRSIGNAALRRLATHEDAPAPEGVERLLQAEQGRGQPLTPGVRREMEAGFGASFQGVRVHTDPPAAAAADQLEARAFAHGQDVFFGTGEYQPETTAGQRVLAHELAHVVQQGGGVQAKLLVGAASDPAEKQADAAAEQVVASIHRDASPEDEELQGLRRENLPDEDEQLQDLRRYGEAEALGTLRREPGTPAPRRTLYSGSVGPDVEECQQKLNNTTSVQIAVDGKFGGDTRAAVLDFQRRSALKEDGVVGERTWQALDAYVKGAIIPSEEIASLGVQVNAAKALRNAGQYEAAMNAFAALYADPRLEEKPMLRFSITSNYGYCMHALAAQAIGVSSSGGAAPAIDPNTGFDDAIGLYAEAITLPGITPKAKADQSNNMRQARLRRPPLPL